MIDKIMIFSGLLLAAFCIFAIVGLKNDANTYLECSSKGGTLVRVHYGSVVCARLEIIK